MEEALFFAGKILFRLPVGLSNEAVGGKTAETDAFVAALLAVWCELLAAQADLIGA